MNNALITPKEIKKIAKEFTMYVNNCVDWNLEDMEDYQTAVALMDYLSKNSYVIVSKEKLQAEYRKSYSDAFAETTCLDRQYARGRYQVLRDTFGKEIFNELNNEKE